MTNSIITANLVEKLTRRITHRMTEHGEDYATAKAAVLPSTTAGPAVWAILDAKDWTVS